jgi:hypothetical protein
MSLEDQSYDSDAVAFKTVDIKQTSITVSGSFTAFQERTWTTTITLSEEQDFAYAIAYYDDFMTLDGKKWRQLPTFNAYIPTDIDITTFYVYYRVSGNQVTFYVGGREAAGMAENITTTTINFIYVTYRTDS